MLVISIKKNFNNMFALFLSFSLCWWDTGHYLIARIAQLEITPEQNQWITDLFALWPGEAGDMVNMSAWQDSIGTSNSQIRTMKTWHYSDEPYIVEPADQAKVPPICYNVTDICNECMKFLLDKSTTSPWALSFGLRSFIHFIGDSHQPLHSATLFSNEFKTGDVGGNIYYFNSQYGANAGQLHKIWDNAGLQYQFIKPLETFEANVSNLIKTHPKSKYQNLIDDENAYHWVLESFEEAKRVAYTAKNNEKLEASYLQAVRETSNDRIVLSGYRLGRFLNKFFETRGLPELYTPFSKEHTKLKASEIAAWVIDALCILYLIVDKVLSIFVDRIPKSPQPILAEN